MRNRVREEKVDDVRQAARLLGRRGAQATNARLTPAQRRRNARMGARAKWAVWKAMRRTAQT